MNAPTLIVGLGGKGSDVALRVSRMVSDEQRQRIAFAVFDTDVNELRVIKEKNPFVHTIQTSTKLSVGQYLSIDDHARETWFPINAILNSKTLTEGAGQVRAVSRLAFETAVKAGKMEELHAAIESLYQLEGGGYQQALRVIIVSSLAGGTGSGLILPVALYIKNYLATRFNQSANITRGFFLLPEVFYGVITGQAERNNLKSNAYATLREIDAFLMKGDATLPSKYLDSVKVDFPGVASDEYEEYNIRPFDFCFLFDAQNIDGNKLATFEDYLDHAANCIYAQSIGPMNKRSNSSEDNTIRKLAQERGRNRYAGAGTSLLTYPTDTVKRYLALNWAKESTSGVWLMFDKEFRALRKQDAEKRRMGVHTPDRDRASSYIGSVENNAKNKVPFARIVQDSCTVYSESGEAVGYSWTEYMDALQQKIDEDSEESGAEKLDGLKADATNSINGIEVPQEGSYDDVYDAFVSTYDKIKTYRRQVTKHVETASSAIAYSLFHTDDEESEGLNSDAGKAFVLEKYMRTGAGNFIHPCAVRLFLYHVAKDMTAEIEDVKERIKKDTSYFENFENMAFGDGDDIKDTVNDLERTKKVSILDKLKKRLSTELEDVIQAYHRYILMTDEEKMHNIYLSVLEEGLEYVKGLISAYEKFFDSFENKITGMQREIRDIEGKYANQAGKAARYVCASKTCLNKMLENMPYTGGVLEIDSDLCKAIYSRVKTYATRKIVSEDGSYFQSLFDNDIIGYYEKELIETYGGEVNMDIITAIEKEAAYEHDIYDEDEIKNYVVHVIKEAKDLAAPFIEKPMGEERLPINSCAYNDKLSPNDDSPRAMLVDEQLKQFGGETDPDIPINQILFYKSFYGLRANDLSKFAPPKKGTTHDRSAGEYFKAYYELVSKIYPDPQKSLVITPHIDRWWHIVSKMPDLDDENQENQLNRIYAAFFWGFVENIFSLSQLSNETFVYRIQEQKIISKNFEDGDKLIVSNGSYCDKFDEVLDAITIFPELVDGILNYVQEELDKDLYEGCRGLDNALIANCNNFGLPVKGVSAKDSGKRSVFEFPFEYRRSVKSESYDDNDALRMAEVILHETERVIKEFCSDSEFAETLGEFYEDHFNRLLDAVIKNDPKGKKIGSDYLFTAVSTKIADKFEEIGMRKKSRDIKDKIRELTQG